MITAYLGKKYGLDYIPGAYDSCVLYMGYDRPSNRYKDECCRIKRIDIGDEKDIGYVGSSIEREAVSNFCKDTTGMVTTIYNASKTNNKKNAIQLSVGNMPIIYENGEFMENGFKFTNTNSTYLRVAAYDDINFIQPILCTYMNCYITYNGTSYAFLKSPDVGYREYGVLFIPGYYEVYIDSSIKAALPLNYNTNHKYLYAWNDKNTNGIKSRNKTNNNADTLNKNLNQNIGNLDIGRSAEASYYYYGGFIRNLAFFSNNQYDNYNELSRVI
jgi:hypothetical protein